MLGLADTTAGGGATSSSALALALALGLSLGLGLADAVTEATAPACPPGEASWLCVLRQPGARAITIPKPTSV